jgi:two-component system, chemotaxis family, protein-glutamate methylesterase/glutaminase
MLRVLVAEDSVTARELLVAILRSDSDIVVVGEAKNGAEAVALTKELKPDVVTMDIRMPTMDGFEATRQIMVEAPTPIVIVSGTVDGRDVETSLHALRAGALTVMPKPPGPDGVEFEDACRHLVRTIKAMAAVKVVRRWPERRPQRRVPPATALRARPRIVVMAASTGGPAALARILSDLPPDFDLPIVVVQHIASGFVEGFATWLNTLASLPVTVARDGDALRPGSVLVAPDDAHLTVADPSTVAVSHAPPVGGFRPSGSVLFESAAHVFGSAAVAVILTGMGEDGVAGLHAVRRAGGRIIAQDEETSVVFGMPGAAVAGGLPDMLLPLDAIHSCLQDLMRA